MRKQLLWLFAFFLIAYNSYSQCDPGQDTTPPVFGDSGNGSIASPFRSLALSVVGNVPSGRYYFNFNGNTFQGELDNDTDGGGWLMILNYVHIAGDNSDLTVRNRDVPLLNSSTLGDNEAGTDNWGHFGNELAKAIDFEEMRFYGITTGHDRIIDFTTKHQNVLDYVKTGVGSFDGINNAVNYTALSEHSAFIPFQGFNEWRNRGDLALTDFPFWAAGSYHWGIRGGGSRWEVDDHAINSESTIHRVWVRGDLSPAGGNEITVQLDNTGNIVITPELFDPIATDNCGNVNFSLSRTDFDCTDLGSHTIQLIATDDQNNSVSMDVTVIVEDTSGPEINIATDLSVPFDLDPITNTFTLTPTLLGLTATDNCELQDVTINNTEFDCNSVSRVGVTITATDIHGNESVQHITIQIRDTVNPIVNCVAPFTVILDEEGSVNLSVDDIGTFSDNCNANAWLDRNYFSCADIGDHVVTLFVQDNSGNQVSCSTTVTIDVACPTDIIVENDPNQCGAIVNYPGCYTLISGLDSGSFFPLGTTTNVIEITDANGITRQCEFDVTVNDTQAPLFIAQDQTIILDQSGTTIMTEEDLIGVHPAAPQYVVETSGTFDPVDISSIGTEVILRDDDISAAIPFGFVFDFYGMFYTEFYIASNGFITFTNDEGSCCRGQELPDTNRANNLIAFDWNDIDPSEGGTIRYAIIGTAPNRIAIVDFDNVAHNYDNIDPTTVQVKMFEATNHIEIHATSIPLTDPGNNRKTQGVENNDGTRAVVVPGRNSSTWSATNEYIAFIPNTEAYDNCGIDTIEISKTTFDCTDIGMNQVDIVISDINGNTVQQTANINVTTIDNTPPVITLNGGNPQFIELGDGYTELGASTDDGSEITIDSSDFRDELGSYQIRYMATDNLCNEAEVIRIVIVQDNTPPVITLNGDNPQFIELGDGYTELGASTDDGSEITIDSSDFIDVVGTYSIRYNATDENGNDANEVARIVEVVDTTAPIITLLGDNPQVIELGLGYTELGAITDDGSTVTIDSSDFEDAVGIYTVRYNAIDDSNNVATEVTRVVEVITGCPLNALPSDNFNITVAGETCVGKNNGIITINTLETQDYIATINNQTYNFTSQLEVPDLTPGNYTVCVAIAEVSGCEQCYELAIAEANTLNGFVDSITASSNSLYVTIASGTPPYTVTINDEIIGEFTTNNFTVKAVKEGLMEVSSSLPCEGKLSKRIERLDAIMMYPNPTKSNVTIELPSVDSKVMEIEIRNTLGRIVAKDDYSIVANKAMISMENLSAGIYFITLKGLNNKVLKVIKE
ncbi:immunoglobulin-like domain-containing protein [Aquimarina rhabdastrellae]